MKYKVRVPFYWLARGQVLPRPWERSPLHLFTRECSQVVAAGPGSSLLSEPCLLAVDGALASAAMWWAYGLLVVVWVNGPKRRLQERGLKQPGQGGPRQGGGLIVGGFF
jgi:hypothetical protein